MGICVYAKQRIQWNDRAEEIILTQSKQASDSSSKSNSNSNRGTVTATVKEIYQHHKNDVEVLRQIVLKQDTKTCFFPPIRLRITLFVVCKKQQHIDGRCISIYLTIHVHTYKYKCMVVYSIRSIKQEIPTHKFISFTICSFRFVVLSFHLLFVHSFFRNVLLCSFVDLYFRALYLTTFYSPNIIIRIILILCLLFQALHIYIYWVSVCVLCMYV